MKLSEDVELHQEISRLLAEEERVPDEKTKWALLVLTFLPRALPEPLEDLTAAQTALLALRAPLKGGEFSMLLTPLTLASESVREEILSRSEADEVVVGVLPRLYAQKTHLSFLRECWACPRPSVRVPAALVGLGVGREYARACAELLPASAEFAEIFARLASEAEGRGWRELAETARLLE